MHAEIFALCDSATNNRDKLNILGTFDSIWSKKLPILHPFCTVALRLRLNRIEQGAHDIKIAILNKDGKEMIKLLDKVIPIQVKGQDHTGTLNIVLNIQNLKLDQYGAYAVVLTVDKRAIVSLPLYVRQSPQRPR
jgi:hypothetical protein